MSEPITTPFSDKCSILAELWMTYRNDEGVKELMDYGDIGLPLAYSISEGIIESSPLAEEYISEIWDLFLSMLEIEDTGTFITLEEVIESSGFKI